MGFQGRNRLKLIHWLTFLTVLLSTCHSAQSRIRGSTNRQDSNNNNEQLTDFSVPAVIPSLRDTVELGHLSSMVYGFHHGAQNCSSFPTVYQQYIQKISPSIFINGNATFTCHMYEKDEQDTQVLVLSKDEQDGRGGYVAIVYAGTDDFRTMLTDANVFTKVFGPTAENGTHPLAPSDDIRVHGGFNNAVFTHGLFGRIKDKVGEIKAQNPNYRILTTGHSLGAADAVLTAVALKLQDQFADELILSISFGCPKTGNSAWREFVNSMDGISIWRLVNSLDLVPRLPGVRFHHVGHTLQMDGGVARAYWLHDGDKALGYRGVPFGWNTLPYALAPAAAVDHMIGRYTKYLDFKSFNDRETYYVSSFEKIAGGDDDGTPDGSGDDDDVWVLPDDYVQQTIEILEDQYVSMYAEEYLELIREERDDEDVNEIFHGSNFEETM